MEPEDRADESVWKLLKLRVAENRKLSSEIRTKNSEIQKQVRSDHETTLVLPAHAVSSAP
jgi:hypothetical protein